MIGHESERGFGLVEFLMGSLIMLVLAASAFGVIAGIQRAAGLQAGIQEATEHARMALETVERILELAGNDPWDRGFEAITILGPSEVRVLSDLTGSAGPGEPDKGDPDGDTVDSGEDVTISHSAATRTLRISSGQGTAQPVASGITEFAMRFFDVAGFETEMGGEVHSVIVTLTAESAIYSIRQTTIIPLRAR